MKEKEYTAAELIKRIRARYASNKGWIVCEQVAERTGFASSWIDAVAVNFWPSSGLMRAAFEVKTTRNDFLRELQAPAKNRWVRGCCHEFWFIAARGVILDNEVPTDSGWMIPHGDGLRIMKAAPRNAAAELDELFACSLLRAVVEAEQRRAEDERKSILESSVEYRDAKRWQDAAEQFMKTKGMGNRFYPCNKNALELLLEASGQSLSEAERNQALQALAHFRESIQALFQIFVQVAHLGILEQDETREYLIKSWGITQQANELAYRRAKDEEDRAIRETIRRLAEGRKKDNVEYS